MKRFLLITLAVLATLSMTGFATAGEQCCKKRAAAMVDGVMKRMPHMTYKVGDYTTGCSKSAMTKAGESGKMQYVVGEQTFDCKVSANKALAEQLEAEAKSMSKVVFAVGDETYCCPMTAGQKAKSAGKKMTYQVAGLNFNTQEKADRAAQLIAKVLESQETTRPPLFLRAMLALPLANRLPGRFIGLGLRRESVGPAVLGKG